MGVRRRKQAVERLSWKTLEARFLAEIQDGLGCSPFEAQAVLDVVEEVYFPFLDGTVSYAPPGKVTLVAVDAEEPAGKPVAECRKQTVCVTVHRGRVDDEILDPALGSPASATQAVGLCI